MSVGAGVDAISVGPVFAEWRCSSQLGSSGFWLNRVLRKDDVKRAYPRSEGLERVLARSPARTDRLHFAPVGTRLRKAAATEDGGEKRLRGLVVATAGSKGLQAAGLSRAGVTRPAVAPGCLSRKPGPGGSRHPFIRARDRAAAIRPRRPALSSRRAAQPDPPPRRFLDRSAACG